MAAVSAQAKEPKWFLNEKPLPEKHILATSSLDSIVRAKIRRLDTRLGRERDRMEATRRVSQSQTTVAACRRESLLFRRRDLLRPAGQDRPNLHRRRLCRRPCRGGTYSPGEIYPRKIPGQGID